VQFGQANWKGVVRGGDKQFRPVKASHVTLSVPEWVPADDSNCKTAVIQLPNGKTLGGQIAQAKYKTMEREDFAKMKELSGMITLASGI
jgi:hypothetical protein